MINQERKSPQKDQIAKTLEMLRETADMADLFMKKLFNGDVLADKAEAVMTPPPADSTVFMSLWESLPAELCAIADSFRRIIRELDERLLR